MNVLITGVAGLTGAHLLRECLDAGDHVVGVDNFFRGTRENLASVLSHPNFTFHECDFRAYIENPPDDVRFDGIYHLAAIVPTKYFYEDPQLTYEVNCHGTYQLFRWALSRRIPRFVNASSSEIYGHIADFPAREDAPSRYDAVEVSPRWSYAHGKILTEYLLNQDQREIDVCHLRYANVYGPYDVDDHHVLPYMLRCIRDDRPVHLNVHADTIRRSFLYMSDCAHATRLAMLHMKSGRSYNIANPAEVTMRELWDLALRVMAEGFGLRYGHEPIYDVERAGDPQRRVLDIGRARAELGYEPRVQLYEGLKRTAQWMADCGGPMAAGRGQLIAGG